MQYQFTTKDIQRFWSHVDKSGECWIWRGGTRNGYGHFWLRPRGVRAHRFAYILMHGPIPDEIKVLHSCDNRPCVRHDHLFVGTPVDNMRDARNKGRLAVGEANGRAKLTASQVIAVRGFHAGGLTQKSIATTFGVDRSTVWAVLRGLTWNHIA